MIEKYGAIKCPKCGCADVVPHQPDETGKLEKVAAEDIKETTQATYDCTGCGHRFNV